MSEACILFGWTPETCLKMQAKHFFSVLNSGKQIKFRDKMKFLAELVDVSFTPLGGMEYAKKLSTFYFNLGLSQVDREERDEFTQQVNEEAKKNAIDASTNEAQEAMLAFVASHRISNYGR